ncbi:MAG: hypothetical protein HYV33_02215 [Candidatus Kerfeldbacteria bacterium]|nr:hypothetical protein [Candidatus Kerfeldbacteria bacterium]
MLKIIGLIVALVGIFWIKPVTVQAAVQLGTDVTVFNWGETQTKSIKNKQWALALVHAHQLMKRSGLKHYPTNVIFATAIKESNLQSTWTDGYFQIEQGTAYAELQRIWPERFADVDYASVIGTNHFVTAAIAKAYYDIFTKTMLNRSFDYRFSEFVDQSQDTQAGIKIISIAYNRGLWFQEFNTIFNTDRANCLAKTNLLDCLQDDTAHDHATAISDITSRLQHPSNYNGYYYHTQLSWSDFITYLNTISALYPKLSQAKIQSAIERTFNRYADSQGKLKYRQHVQAVINAIINQTGTIDSSPVCAYYGC